MGGECVLLNDYYKKRSNTLSYSIVISKLNNVLQKKNRTIKEIMNIILISSSTLDNL